MNEADFRQKENRLEIGDIRLYKGDISLSREKNGNLSLLSLMSNQQKSPSGTTGKWLRLHRYR